MRRPMPSSIVQGCHDGCDVKVRKEVALHPFKYAILNLMTLIADSLRYISQVIYCVPDIYLTYKRLHALVLVLYPRSRPTPRAW